MSLILDSSVTLAWFYSDETTPAIRELFARVATAGAWVPSLWRLEVANVLETGVRRKRHNFVFLEATLSDLALLPIRLDADTDQRAWNSTLRLAHQHQLTLYDAAYLELAQRRKYPLATLDRDLRHAAAAEHVPLLGL